MGIKLQTTIRLLASMPDLTICQLFSLNWIALTINQESCFTGLKVSNDTSKPCLVILSCHLANVVCPTAKGGFSWGHKVLKAEARLCWCPEDNSALFGQTWGIRGEERRTAHDSIAPFKHYQFRGTQSHDALCKMISWLSLELQSTE